MSPLVPAERARLTELEAVIERGLATFTEVGEALLEVRDSRLYLATHTSFEAYCRERWNLGRSHAYRLMDSAEVVRALSPAGDTAPPTERVARELVPLLREGEREVVEVWRELHDAHGPKLTAEKVRVAVTDRLAFEQKVGSLKSTNSVEWYTPQSYVEAARRVLGDIDLDPASSADANATIGATTYYTAADDGLAHPWRGRVFMNPPYGTVCGRFVAKLLDGHRAGEVVAAIALLNAYATDVRWFRPLWDHTLCFTDHRIDFRSPVHRRSSSTTGSVFVYLGSAPEAFAAEFSRFGAIVRKWTPCPAS